MTKNLIILALLTTLCSCGFLSSGSGDGDGFFETRSGWDIKHIPIIPPFLASSTYPDTWLIGGGSDKMVHLGRNRYGVFNVSSFGVSRNFIYGITAPEYPKEVQKWFLFNTLDRIYAEYLTESELLNTLDKYQLEKRPIIPCNDLYKQLSEGKRPYWFPPKGEPYPEFENIQPVPSIDLHVKGDERGIDFQAPAIDRLESKIYYFKLRYDKEDNDLFYVSFNNSSPILIKNDLIVPAYAWDDNMEITVYTPYPVAQEQGINEKDRIRVSRTIKLKE